MSRLWIIFGIFSLAALPAHADEPPHEYVVSAIRCTVEDPRNLSSELGLAKGQKIIIESLNTLQSTFFVDDSAYFTGFPAELKFQSDRFVFEGTEYWDGDSLLSLRMQGDMNPPAPAAVGDGYLWFEFKNGVSRRMALATLGECARIK